MKGLFLAFGLIAALFFQPVLASDVAYSIFDSSSFHQPKSDSLKLGVCQLYYGTSPSSVVTFEECSSLGESTARTQGSYVGWLMGDSYIENSVYNGYPAITLYIDVSNTSGGRVTASFWYNTKNEDSNTCPPTSFPNYTFGLDFDSDGKIDKCFDPNELDNASKCSELFNSGSILPVGSNTAPLVCKSFQDGSRCAFSLVSQGNTPYYQPNLEKGCFGDAEEIPDYDKNANQPQPDTDKCVPYAGGYACSADPNQYCSADHRCVDGCGYVNDQFICFRDEQCTGASCEPAPINCENSPDAPVCKDKQTTPEPTFCEKNPTVQSCQSGSDFCKQNPLAPSCQLGGSGGGGSDFVFDYDKLINGMKDAVKLIIDPSETPEFSEFKSEIDDKTSELDTDIDGFMNGSHFDGINDQISDNPFSGQFQLPSGGGCTAFELGGHSLDLCSVAQKISSVLYFVFAFLTMLHLKNLFFSTVTPRKE